jgi:hypothetical protein
MIPVTYMAGAFFQLEKQGIPEYVNQIFNKGSEDFMNIFEAVMMICFGASWPVSIWKTIKVKNPIGKSVVFLWLVEIGYLSGIIYKLSRPDWVIALYCLNALMVGTDLFLVVRYSRMRRLQPDSKPHRRQSVVTLK